MTEGDILSSKCTDTGGKSEWTQKTQDDMVLAECTQRRSIAHCSGQYTLSARDPIQYHAGYWQESETGGSTFALQEDIVTSTSIPVSQSRGDVGRSPSWPSRGLPATFAPSPGPGACASARASPWANFIGGCQIGKLKHHARVNYTNIWRAAGDALDSRTSPSTTTPRMTSSSALASTKHRGGRVEDLSLV